MRILLIDDSAAYREEFAVLLQDARIPHSVLDTATTIDQGAALMAAAAHDIYIIDYRLPGGDGIELVRKARKAGMAEPIIVLTGHGAPAIDEAAEDAGATDFIPKDELSPQVLSRAIRYAVRNAAAVKGEREAVARFRMAQEISGIGTWDWDIRRNTKIWSPTVFTLYGIAPTQAGPLAYDTWRQRLHPDDREMAQRALAAAVLGEAPFDVQFRILRLDPARPQAPPALRWIASKGHVLRDPSGAAQRMIGICIDTTDQQNTMAALRAGEAAANAGLRASEARFQTYFDNVAECLFYARRDLDGTFRYEALNRAGLASVGKTLEETVGRTPVEVLGPEAGALMMDALRRVYETEQVYQFEPTYDLPSGSVTFDAIYAPFFNEAGEIIGVLGSGRDITERRRLEAALRQSQKMEALGHLAGGVAHDFNNLLTGILGCFEMLGRQQTSERGKRLVAEGVRAVERSTALTARLLAFSRQQPLATEPVDINASLDEISEMLSRTLGSAVRIGKDLANDLWRAVTDRNQIELAILNIGINARDAMPLGGTLTISTRNETVAEPHDGLAAGDYVAIAMTDTGTGMTPDVLARVREPFFTTKPPGKGTGLGLSMVAGIIQQFSGGLTITSEPDKGTSVTLFLPRAPAEALAVVPASSGPAPAACILLVESDPGTQAAVAAYLAELGHSLAVANDAGEALSLLDAGRDVDVMIVDSTLPGKSYADLTAQAWQRRPGLPVLLLSATSQGPTLDGLPVLAKPFRRDAFDQAVAILLRDRKPSAQVIELERHRSGNALS